MKKFLLYLIAIIGVVVAFALINDFATVAVIERTSTDSAYKMKRLYGTPISGEMPILGSSRAVNNYVPSLLSTNCYDYGVSGLTAHELVHHIRAVAAHSGDAPVIINIDPWGTLGGKFVGDYRLAPQSGLLGLSDRITGIRFHGALRPAVNRLLNERAAIANVSDCGAVLLKAKRTPEDWMVINAREEPMTFKFNADLEQELCDALRALAPRRAVLVVCPCSIRFMELFEGREALDAFLDRLSKIENVVVFNFYGDKSFADEDFCNTKHFTLDGARKFTRMLVGKLKDERILSD